MRQLLITLISAAVLMGLVVWDERPGRNVPTWLYLLATAPLAWVRIFGSTQTKEASQVKKSVGLLYLLAASIFLMLVGSVGKAMRGSWAEILSPALPFGSAVFCLTLLAILLRSKL